MILVAGPFRSGTGDDPARIAENLAVIRSATLALFRAGHLAINGEDIALPLTEVAGSAQIGDQAFDEVFHAVDAAWSSAAMPSCASPATRRARTRWSRSRVRRDCPSTTT